MVDSRKNLTFLDPFCGSGIVSRTARSMGMNVLANDIEPFSFLVNYVYLHLTQEDLSHMFDFMGGIDAYYSFLNFHGMYAFTSGYAEGKQLLSKFYAPQVTKEIKEGAERVYFSHENALFIDAVREEIEQSWIDGKLTGKEKAESNRMITIGE